MTNPFNQQLLAAKKKQHLLYIAMLALFFIGAFIVLAVILASRGTRIEIHPDDAAVSSSVRLHKGVAVIVGETLYSISKRPAITVSAEGFRPITQTLNSNDFGKVISVTLVPLPAKIKLRTNIDNDKISWLINGEVLAISEKFEHELPAGNYQLTITHPHYHDASTAMSLSRNEVFEDVIPLRPIDGSLAIKTTPKAHVSINTVDKGLSPLSLSLHGGVHNVAITLNGYEPINDTIEVSRSEPNVNRDYRLELKKASVIVSLKPSGGKLTLDNIAVNNAHKLAVAAGIKHRITYSKAGYFSESKTFNIAAADVLQLSFSLKKEMGMVEIESSPAAEVVLNGKLVGTTPLQLSLNAVKQKITLKKKGFRSITKVVMPSAANAKKINVILVNEKIAQLKEAPNRYTHKAGGKLKLFRPNDTFTMGAKRSELGQRANEIIKKTRLTKAFYAGIYEVTNEEYRQYNHNTQGPPKNPVTSISWIDAAKFCNWLSQQEGLSLVYRINNNHLEGINTNANGYRLLTEAEWEWLARKSGKATQTLFVWGNERVIPKNAVNIADESANGKVKVFVSKYNDGFSEIAPVGSFSQEKSGLYDQGGNVSEWTHDSYSIVLAKSGKVLQDPFDLTVGNSHVVKGANWRSGSATELRPSFREGLSNPRDDLGFRIGRYVYGGNYTRNHSIGRFQSLAQVSERGAM
ncbi:MAG: SUMF1/EgtB/PvdO family nonheme iron enzyme [Methylophaga sp.]|nr:SUMF1/EgtB/PvdO family nonheme iron enzyme [Methylophaga sp.]